MAPKRQAPWVGPRRPRMLWEGAKPRRWSFVPILVRAVHCGRPVLVPLRARRAKAWDWDQRRWRAAWVTRYYHPLGDLLEEEIKWRDGEQARGILYPWASVER